MFRYDLECIIDNLISKGGCSLEDFKNEVLEYNIKGLKIEVSDDILEVKGLKDYKVIKINNNGEIIEIKEV